MGWASLHSGSNVGGSNVVYPTKTMPALKWPLNTENKAGKYESLAKEITCELWAGESSN